MEMDKPLIQALKDLIAIEQAQLQKMEDMTMKQAQQLTISQQQAQEDLVSKNSQRDNSANSKNNQQTVTAQPMMEQQQLQNGGTVNFASHATNPYSYQMYAPQYLPPGFNVANGMSPRFDQMSAYASDLKGSKTGNYGFIDSIIPQNSRMSDETRHQLQQDYSHRAANATMAAGSAVVSTGASIATMAATSSLMGGLILGAGVGAGVGFVADTGLEEGKKFQAYSKYLNRESYRFINARESNNERRPTGFSLKETHDASDFLRTVNTELFVKDDEMMSLLKKYTESGLLRDTEDLTSFKKQIKTLTKGVKGGAVMLNETYDEIASLMSDMKKLGVSDKNYEKMMGLGKIVGSELGQSGSETIKKMMSLVEKLVSGTNLSGEHYTNRVGDSMTYMNFMYEGLKKNPNRDPKQDGILSAIRNFGGVEMASGAVIEAQDKILNKYNYAAASFFDYNEGSNSWEFNRRSFEDFRKQDKTLQELISDGENKFLQTRNRTGNDIATLDWQKNFKMYIGNSLGETDTAALTKSLVTGFNREIGANPNDLALGLSVMDGEMDPALRNLMAGYLDTHDRHGETIKIQTRNKAIAESLNAKIKVANPTFRERISAGFENFKQKVGGFGVGVTKKFESWGQKLSDKVYGRSFTDLNFSNNAMMKEGVEGFTKAFDTSVSNVNQSISNLQKSGINVDPKLINVFSGLGSITSSSARSASKTYDQRIDRITDPNQLDSTVKGRYSEIKSVAGQRDLSETILAALVKFSTKPEGKKFFGANDETIKDIAKNNSLNVSDPSKASSETQLKLVGEHLQKLVGLYGGNEGLAMKAFFSGKSTVDQELKRLGYDVEKLRGSGDQGKLQGIDINVASASHQAYTEYKNSLGASGAFPVNYQVSGTRINTNSLAPNQYYKTEYDYSRGGKSQKASDKYYDEVHFMAEQLGLSPNALAAVLNRESGSGDPKLRGSSGEIGLMQIMPDMHYNNFRGQNVPLPNGGQFVIGTNGLVGDLEDPLVSLYMGGSLYKSHLEKAQGNPILAYVGYNAGGGSMGKVIASAQNDGLNPQDLTTEQISGYLRSHNLTMAAKNIEGFAPIYFEGLMGDTKISKEEVSAALKTETREVTKDAATNKVVSKAEHKAQITSDLFDEITARQEKRNKIREFNKGFVDNESFLKIKDIYSKGSKSTFTGIDENTGLLNEPMISFKPKQREEMLKTMGKFLGVDTSGKMDRSKRVNTQVAMDEWYQKNTALINESVNLGQSNDYNRMTTAEKVQTIDLIEKMSNSGLVDTSGDTLSYNDLVYHKSNKKGDTSKERFLNERDKAELKKIDRHGLYNPTKDKKSEIMRSIGHTLNFRKSPYEAYSDHIGTGALAPGANLDFMPMQSEGNLTSLLFNTPFQRGVLNSNLPGPRVKKLEVTDPFAGFLPLANAANNAMPNPLAYRYGSSVLGQMINTQRTNISSVNDVAGVQAAMKEEGLYNGPIDGVAGKSTVSAIETYKNKNNLTQSGKGESVIDESLIKNINKKDGVLNSLLPGPRRTSESTKKGDPGGLESNYSSLTKDFLDPKLSSKVGSLGLLPDKKGFTKKSVPSDLTGASDPIKEIGKMSGESIKDITSAVNKAKKTIEKESVEAEKGIASFISKMNKLNPDSLLGDSEKNEIKKAILSGNTEAIDEIKEKLGAKLAADSNERKLIDEAMEKALKFKNLDEALEALIKMGEITDIMKETAEDQAKKIKAIDVFFNGGGEDGKLSSDKLERTTNFKEFSDEKKVLGMTPEEFKNAKSDSDEALVKSISDAILKNNSDFADKILENFDSTLAKKLLEENGFKKGPDGEYNLENVSKEKADKISTSFIEMVETQIAEFTQKDDSPFKEAGDKLQTESEILQKALEESAKTLSEAADVVAKSSENANTSLEQSSKALAEAREANKNSNSLWSNVQALIKDKFSIFP